MAAYSLFNNQTLENGEAGNTCVMGTTFTVTLPYSAPALYSHGDGLTTSFALQGNTTTFIADQIITIVYIKQQIGCDDYVGVLWY